MTKQELAGQLAAAFQTKTRDDRFEFVSLKDGSPGWMTDAVREAHGTMFPDDFRYAMIEEVAGRLEDCDDWEDLEEALDGLVDVYTLARLRWLASHLDRVGYCDDAVDELGVDKMDLADRIGLGQAREYSEIAGLLVTFLDAKASEDEPAVDPMCSECDASLDDDDRGPSGAPVLCRDCQQKRCTQCGEPNDNGEGWDGLCGNCADKAK